MAKQLYDYWFVQFDFPNEEGKPYKSSGGKMVWTERLKREIPSKWTISKLSEIIRQEKSGDWGKDSSEHGYSHKVSCIRGTDFKDNNCLPVRYIQERNVVKELCPFDIVVEISGGSPTQATGRCIFITKELVEHYDGHIICSNFCQPLTCDNEADALFMYYTWCLIYNNQNMFHYESKTSGIKNFQMDAFLSEYWIKPDVSTLEKFKNIVSSLMSKTVKNNFLNKDLQKQRDSLLPLLMNGQVTINQ